MGCIKLRVESHPKIRWTSLSLKKESLDRLPTFAAFCQGPQLAVVRLAATKMRHVSRRPGRVEGWKRQVPVAQCLEERSIGSIGMPFGPQFRPIFRGYVC